MAEPQDDKRDSEPQDPPRAERPEHPPRALPLAPRGVPRDREQRIGGAGDRGHDLDRGLSAVASDDADGITDRGGVGQRSPAELVDVRGASCWGHGPAQYTAQRMKSN